jgi:hypothetical protein
MSDGNLLPDGLPFRVILFKSGTSFFWFHKKDDLLEKDRGRFRAVLGGRLEWECVGSEWDYGWSVS